MTSRFQSPPIIRAAERLLVELEQAVRAFPARYHRYSIGEDLRRQGADVLRTAWRAWHDQSQRAHWTGELKWAVDELKQTMQIAKMLHAFDSFRRFEHLARQAAELGAQAGGWHRKESPRVQNAGGHRAVPQRDQKLSTRTASAGANP